MTVLSGILDVITFVSYHVFATKQTGNFLFPAVYTVSNKNLVSKIEGNVVVSMLLFCIGNFVFGRFAHHHSARCRAWLISSTLVQAMLTLVAALLQWVTVPGKVTNASSLIIVAMLALAASGQNSMAITVGLAELNTSMVTGAIVSILNDSRIFEADNRARNRRVFFVASYAAGCIIGATMTFETVGSLLLVCAIKLVISVSFLLNRGNAAPRFPAAAAAQEDHYELDTPGMKASWSD